MVPDDLHTTIAGRLRGAGQRYTGNRRSLVCALDDADHPVTIGEILAGRGLAQSSVYRNLTVLEQAGVVRRVTGSDEFARFELAEDLTDHHHHHLICSGCGAVADFTVSPQLERTLEAMMERVGQATGFRSDHHRLDLVGHCADCDANPSEASEASG
jgi:Fur family ferric uptake transcriptional regulator